MNRRHFSPAEIAEAVREIEAGVRLVPITMVEPPDLVRAARLLEVGLSVTARSSRLMLELPPHDPTVDGSPQHQEGAEALSSQTPNPPCRAEEARSP